MRRLQTLGLGLVALAMLAAAPALAGPRIAVVDFDNQSQHSDRRLGSGAADMLTTELVRESDFQVFERERLNNILREQDFGASGRVDPSTAAQIGQVIGVDYIVTGAVTEYGESERGGRGFGVSVGRRGYVAAVDVRVVNTKTGQIAFAESGSGSEKSVSVSVRGIGGGERFDEKRATAAMRKAIEELVGKFSSADLPTLDVADSGPTEILVADVYNDVITLNSGEGLSEGQTVTIKREGRVITDPESGEVIRVRYEDVGQIRITQVSSSFAEGEVINGSGFEVGDIAE